MGNHQAAFVKVRVLTAPQLTLPRVQGRVEPDAGGAAIGLCCLRLGELLQDCAACGWRFLCAIIQRFSSTITSRTAGVQSEGEMSLQQSWAIQTRGDDGRGHIPWVCCGVQKCVSTW